MYCYNPHVFKFCLLELYDDDHVLHLKNKKDFMGIVRISMHTCCVLNMQSRWFDLKNKKNQYSRDRGEVRLKFNLVDMDGTVVHNFLNSEPEEAM